MELKSRLNGLADRKKWVGWKTSFAAKFTATKLVWFPPDPAKTGRSRAATAKKTTKRAAKKATGAAKKATGAAKKISQPTSKKA